MKLKRFVPLFLMVISTREELVQICRLNTIKSVWFIDMGVYLVKKLF